MEFADPTDIQRATERGGDGSAGLLQAVREHRQVVAEIGFPFGCSHVHDVSTFEMRHVAVGACSGYCIAAI